MDNGPETLQKKIRNGEIAQYNFILGEAGSVRFGSSTADTLQVVGEDELRNRSVNVRNRDDVGTKARSEMLPLDDVSTKLVNLKASRALGNRFA